LISVFLMPNASEYCVLTITPNSHDFQGRNDAPNGLALVVTALKGVRILEDFTPTVNGADSVNSATKTNVISPQAKQAYVTFGAGFSTQELNDQLAPSKLFALGAAHGEVSVAGGWAQNAGHSAVSPRYGLGADQPVEYKVVTADGELKIANAVSNPDLFWALRGGGGGEFDIHSKISCTNFSRNFRRRC
jgi:FAD/FMN-containing dehydrogenase